MALHHDGSGLDGLQQCLGYAGLTPGVGIFADALDLVISVVRGDVQSAGVALAAMVPGFGQGARVADVAVAARRQTTILGENMTGRVIPFANQTGARTLPWGTTAEEWAKMTPREKWKLNDGALRARINEGDNFRYIGIDPLRPQSFRDRFDLTRSELLRLEDRGIPYEAVSPEEVKSVIGTGQ